MDDFAARISFFLNAQMDFFEEIAKFRAARRIWATIMKKRFKARDEKSLMCRFHVQTAGSSLAAQQIDNNVVRTAFEALSAVLGGTQSLHTNARDEALSLPTEASAQLALRTQQVIAHETGITNAVDPMGGSWYVEKMTDLLEEEVFEMIKKIDDLGGSVSAIKSGYIQDEIARSAYEYQKKVDSGEQVVVGLNRYKRGELEQIDLQEIDQAAVTQQLERLARFKENRDDSNAEKSLSEMQKAAESNDNLMPFIIDCAKNNCTLGEISHTLKEVFGEYKPA